MRSKEVIFNTLITYHDHYKKPYHYEITTTDYTAIYMIG